MDLMRTGFKFFRLAVDEDCPMSPDGARRLCDAVARIQLEQTRIKLVIFYIAGLLTVSHGDAVVGFIKHTLF